MHDIIKVIHRTVYYVCFVGMVVLLLMMLLTVSDVIGRSIFNRPITGTFEITNYLLVIIVLFGIAYAEQVGQNIRVELFADKLPPWGQLAIYSIFTFMALAFFSLMVWQGWEEGFMAKQVGTTSDIWNIPAFPFRFLIPFGAFLLSVELLLKLITSVKSLSKGMDEKEMPE